MEFDTVYLVDKHQNFKETGCLPVPLSFNSKHFPTRLFYILKKAGALLNIGA
jgi:hypothetical protein